MSEIDYESSAEMPLPTAKVEQVGKLAKEIVDREKTILEIEGKLEIEEKALNRVQGLTLPELLTEMGITSLRLIDGSELEVKNLYACSISDARKELAHKWLEDNGFGSLIKKKVIVILERGDVQAETDLTSWLAQNKYEFDIDEAVNYKTLESFVKGQMESVEEETVKPPFDLFGIFVAKKATIKNKTINQAKRKYKKK